VAKESKYQKAIMESIIADGGHAVNGIYSKNGEADIQSGMSIVNYNYLLHICIEVKTEEDYFRVMSALKEVGGLYEIIDIKRLKKHEPLQIHKINAVRELGGLAVIAYKYKQVLEYIDNTLERN